VRRRERERARRKTKTQDAGNMLRVDEEGPTRRDERKKRDGESMGDEGGKARGTRARMRHVNPVGDGDTKDELGSFIRKYGKGLSLSVIVFGQIF